MKFMPPARLQAVMLALGLSFAIPAPTAQAQQYSFQTIAGAFDGDGGHAADANLNRPSGIVFDAAGNMLLADKGRHRIRKVTPAGVITTIVGNGIPGYSGDGGADPANSRIHAPGAMVLDAAGNLYFTDTNNHRVRKLGVDGTLSLVAGNGTTTFTGDGGLAVDAGLRAPMGLALDAAGNLYVSQFDSHRVRKIDASGHISTFAGVGAEVGEPGDGGPATQAVVSRPLGLAVDAAGNVLIAELFRGRIRSVSPSGIITNFARASIPWDLRIDTSGVLHVVSDCLLLKFDSQGNQSEIIAGDVDGYCGYSGDGGAASGAKLNQPEGLAFASDGSLVVADTGNGRIRRIAQGQIATIAGRGTPFGNGGPAANAGFTSLTGISLGTDGRVFLADAYPGNQVRVISPAGQVDAFAGRGEMDMSDGDGGPATQAGLFYPFDAAMDAAGNLYIAEYIAGNIRRVSPNGTIETVTSPSQQGIARPRSLAIDSSGNLYIADLAKRRVFKRNAQGIVSVFAGTGIASPVGDGGLATSAAVYPNAVATDRSGNVFIAEESGRIRKVNRDGVISTVADNGALGSIGDGWIATRTNIGNATGIATAPNGDLYIAAGSLFKVTRSGLISTVAELKYAAFDVAIANDGTIYVTGMDGRLLKGMPVQIPLPVPQHRAMPASISK